MIIRYEELQYCLKLMSDGDINVQREGLQCLVSDLFSGKKLLASQSSHLFPVLAGLLISPNAKIRKWAYHVAAAYPQHGDRKRLIEICRRRLAYENDRENIRWIIAVLASFYPKERILEILKSNQKKNPLIAILTDLEISVSGVLFAADRDFCKIDTLVNELRKSDPSIRSWLTKLYGYVDLAKKQNIASYTSEKDMLELIYDGDVQLQEYGLWGLCLHGVDSQGQLQFSPYFYESCYPESQKWFFMHLTSFPSISVNEDYLIHLLRNRNMFDRSSREGIINGLMQAPFSPKYTDLVEQWYIDEKERSVQIRLLAYMIENASLDNSGAFFAILSNEYHTLSDLHNLIQLYIAKTPKSKLIATKDHIYFNREDDGVKNYFLGSVNNPQFIEKYNNYGNSCDIQQQILHLITTLHSVLDAAGEIPVVERSKAEEYLKTISEQLINEKPDKTKLQAAAEWFKKFAQEFGTQLAVSGAISAISDIKQLIEALLALLK